MIDVDPFDLPDWLGEGEVTWETEGAVRRGHRVRGVLTAAGHDAPSSDLPSDQPRDLPCDLLAVDEAHPAPVADDTTRTRAHLAWRHGQILILEEQGRLVLAMPGTSFTADIVLDALSRLAKAVGASPDDYVARLRIGGS